MIDSDRKFKVGFESVKQIWLSMLFMYLAKRNCMKVGMLDLSKVKLIKNDVTEKNDKSSEELKFEMNSVNEDEKETVETEGENTDQAVKRPRGRPRKV